MNEQKFTLKELWRLTATTFTCVILAMSIAGWFFGYELSVVFPEGDDGLSFLRIFQMFLFAVTNSALSLVLITSKFLQTAKLLWQFILVMVSCFIATVILIIIFGWIPRGFLTGWIWFAAIFITLFVTGSLITIVKLHFEEKRYNNLLSDYKKRQGENK